MSSLRYSKSRCVRKVYEWPMNSWWTDPEVYGGITSAVPLNFLRLAHIEYFAGDFRNSDLVSGMAEPYDTGRMVALYANGMGTDRDRF